MGKNSFGGYTRVVKYLVNGDIYSGDFRNSLFDGDGQLIKASGTRYRGSFLKGLPHGNIILQDKTGMGKTIVFENGEPTRKKWKMAVPENANGGFGEIKFPSGNFYLGELNKGIPYGYGMIIYTNGDVLYARFSIEERRIRGIIKAKDGRMIFGYFRLTENEKLSVETEVSYMYIIRYPNGDLYFGKINDSLNRKGAGTCLFKTGDIYIGNYNNDKRNDPEGLMIYKREGISNRRNIYQGPFVNDLIEGEGEFINASSLNPEKFIGNFKNGKLDGEVTVIYTDGKSKKVIFKNGVRQE
jgi:hypothetical protein